MKKAERWKVVDPPSHRSGRQLYKLVSGSHKYVLWVGGSINRVELGILDLSHSGGCAPTSLWELSREDSGKGTRKVALVHVSSCWKSKDDLGKKGPGPGVRVPGFE